MEYEEIDLTYEGIATVIIFSFKMDYREEIDLTYEGIATRSLLPLENILALKKLT